MDGVWKRGRLDSPPTDLKAGFKKPKQAMLDAHLLRAASRGQVQLCSRGVGTREAYQISSFDDQPRTMGYVPICFVARMDSYALPGPTSSFGASFTAKISIDASLPEAIIGKGCVNSKHISRQTGAIFHYFNFRSDPIFIRNHESIPSLKNVELEGSLEQIQEASVMVSQLIMNITVGSGPAKGHSLGHSDNFPIGSCTFGEKCHFAQGAAELRKTVI
ncbi:hypothetical protein MLD38_035633 [Melastoma candidum]|uniref:Uncharacterized protein n=1 Tax=Melastoma candidum TaxID=119954 RepID=A0ACB9LH78_9MYRT|nr:hypothetical protein MLD38_035633 [Melastoma candidum]